MQPTSDSPHVLILPPLLYAIALGGGLLLHFLARRSIFSSEARYWVGGVTLALGLALGIWARAQMAYAGTNVNPTLPTTALVTTGPFRVSRNPLYLALNLLYLGLAFLTNAVAVLALLIPVVLVMHYGVIRREERYLEATFGDTYRGYCSRVRRYL